MLKFKLYQLSVEKNGQLKAHGRAISYPNLLFFSFEVWNLKLNSRKDTNSRTQQSLWCETEVSSGISSQ